MEIDITHFFNTAEPFAFSASVAERGPGAGPETWGNAVREGTDSPLLVTETQIAALRGHMRGFGAWDDEEIAAWSEAECNALLVQLIAGDMREGGLEHDEELSESDWLKFERQCAAGQASGRIGRGVDGKVYYSLGD